MCNCTTATVAGSTNWKDKNFFCRTLWSVIAPGILFHVPVEGSNLEASQKAIELADYYLGGTSNIVPENFDTITDMFTDAFVTYAVECFVEYAHQSQTVYQYREEVYEVVSTSY